MIHSCGSTTLLNTAYRPPPLPLGLSPIPCPSDFRRPSYFGAGLSTHPGVGVNHSHLSTFFWRPPDSMRDPNSTSSMAVVLQECKNNWTRLWIRSIKSAQIDDPLQRPCHIAAWSGQYDTATSPPTSKSGSLIPGSPPLTSKSYLSSVAVLVCMQGHGNSGPIDRLLPLLISGPVPFTGGLESLLPADGRLRVLQKM